MSQAKLCVIFCGRIFFPDYLETLIELKEHQSLN